MVTNTETGTVADWVNEEGMAGEFAADLGDRRRTRRGQQLGVALALAPELSFPKVFVDEAQLEAGYRFVENEAVSWRELAEPHFTNTVARASGDTVLVAHDTTDLSFRTYWPDQIREGLVPVTSRTQGFLLHASMAVTASGGVLPLGVVGLQPFVHRSALPEDDDATHALWHDERGLFDNEHERWFRAIENAEQRFASSAQRPIHVMDREGDSYGLLSWMVRQETSFVVRCDTARRLEERFPLREVGAIEVTLGERFPRGDKSNATHPPRRCRTASLTIRAGKVTLYRTKKSADASWSPEGWAIQPKTLELNLVEAVELDPPAGETGVRWLLLTTEPIDTPQQVLAVVDMYRRRWMIEEYFKALKTGCRMEDRQMNSAPSLLRVLALLVPAAWRLLLLRVMGEEDPDASWRNLLSPLEFLVLQRSLPKARLTGEATARECLLAIAKLGGHLKRNGRPGWQSLHAGWRKLQTYVEGARLAGA